MAQLLPLRKINRCAGVRFAVNPHLYPAAVEQAELAAKGDIRPKPAVHPRTAVHRHVASRNFQRAGQQGVPGEQAALCDLQIAA